MADLPGDISVEEILANLKRLHAEGAELRTDLQAAGRTAGEHAGDVHAQATAHGHESSAHFAHEAAELSHQVLHTAENVIEQVVEHRHHSKAHKETQWFYGRDGKVLGPVLQTELLDLLQRSEVPWNTLVWNKKMTEWAEASETELSQFAESGVPPPLPVAKKKSGARKK
ncbi:MAG TPA: DUF4339 domain-containing protein [Chthoniobacterales bacterium]|nr:DUF4339 domain-containing protein [Chthoniobacterales bacterium]